MDRYAIFDLDGTLNQTDLYSLEAYEEVLKMRNIQVETQKIIDVIGMNPEDTMIHLLGRVLEGEERKQWSEDIDREEYKRMDVCAKAYDGVKEALVSLKEKGFLLAICSNAYYEHVSHVLHAIGLFDMFDMVGSLAMGNTKAEVIRYMEEKLLKGKGVIVGDRRYDMEAAKETGLPFVGCAYGFMPKEIEKADIVIKQPIDMVEAILTLTK